MDEETDQLNWDEAGAELLIGALVLIGVTRTSPDGPIYEQMFGTVVSADQTAGFEIRLDGSKRGETQWLPPVTQSFKPADPGEYRLRTTGEIVVDPDYTAMWTVHSTAN